MESYFVIWKYSFYWKDFADFYFNVGNLREAKDFYSMAMNKIVMIGGATRPPIIETNTVIPASRTERLYTVRDNQTKIRINILKGESMLL